MGIDFDKYYEMNKFSKKNKEKETKDNDVSKVEKPNNYERKFVKRDIHHANHNENNLKNLIKQYGDND